MPIDDPELRGRLERGEVVTELTEGAGGRRDARARALVARPPEAVWDVITDYEHYREFMPLTTASEIRRREGNTVWFYTELSFPLKTIRYEIKLRLDRPRWRVDWTLVEGSLRSNEGSWQLEPYGDGVTYAIYTVYTSVGFAVPSFVMSKLMKGSLPDLLRAVRRRSGDQRFR